MEKTTIAALATPLGTGGIAIIRLSGPLSLELLKKVFVPLAQAETFKSHELMYGKVVYQGKMLDECMAVFMKTPRSYTREDVAEIHLHGGVYVTACLLQALWELGAVPAQAGEFTKRAFLNGRIDLSRAEAVMQIIEASGEKAAKAAVRDLNGGVSAFIKNAQDELTDILSGVAAALDYPEEIGEEEAAADLLPRVLDLAQRLISACDERSARILEKGLEVAIVGRPNVGKSSLLNCLLDEERAIVTDEAGTTRDIIRASMVLGGIRVNFSDTAGIRESMQKAEQIGIRMAMQTMQTADLVLAVFDCGTEMTLDDQEVLNAAKQKPYLLVHNKSDLPDKQQWPCGLRISTKTGEGIEELKAAIIKSAGETGESELSLLRHMQLARQAVFSLTEAAAAMEQGDPLDLVAIHLHEALYNLGEVTGDQVTDVLVDKIFSSFCVGK